MYDLYFVQFALNKIIAEITRRFSRNARHFHQNFTRIELAFTFPWRDQAVIDWRQIYGRFNDFKYRIQAISAHEWMDGWMGHILLHLKHANGSL